MMSLGFVRLRRVGYVCKDLSASFSHPVGESEVVFVVEIYQVVI